MNIRAAGQVLGYRIRPKATEMRLLEMGPRHRMEWLGELQIECSWEMNVL
jgi:hypothetical protein